MPVPAAKVKALCSSTEAELVRNSRPPQIKSLSLAEVKAAKARAASWRTSGRDKGTSRRVPRRVPRASPRPRPTRSSRPRFSAIR